MTTILSVLSSIGITREMLILGFVALAVVGLIGYFWQYILPGAVILCFAYLLYEPTNTAKPTEAKAEQAQVFDEHAAYIKDCIEVAEYSQVECERLWLGKSIEEKSGEAEVNFLPASQVKLLDVDNEEYKARRQQAINKPNAVALQATYH